MYSGHDTCFDSCGILPRMHLWPNGNCTLGQFRASPIRFESSAAPAQRPLPRGFPRSLRFVLRSAARLHSGRFFHGGIPVY